MRRTIQLVTLLALAACQAIGQQTGGGVKVEAAMQASCWILGEDPQIAEVWTNIGDKPVFVMYGAEPASHFAHMRILGAIRKDCQGDWKMIEEGGFISTPPQFEPGKVLRVTHSLRDYGVVDAGHYEAWIEYDTTSAPEHFRQAGLAPLHLESNHVQFEIVLPEGIDATALSNHGNKCHQLIVSPQDILKKYPTSTYAAYAVYSMMARFAQQDPSAVLGLLHDENSYNSNSYPDMTCQGKDGWRWLKGKDAADWWAKWYDIILKNHPDIWFADELRLKRAVDQLALKNFQAGAADLETLSKEAKPDVAQKARIILDAIKQKGWIKS